MTTLVPRGLYVNQTESGFGEATINLNNTANTISASSAIGIMQLNGSGSGTGFNYGFYTTLTDQRGIAYYVNITNGGSALNFDANGSGAVGIGGSVGKIGDTFLTRGIQLNVFSDFSSPASGIDISVQPSSTAYGIQGRTAGTVDSVAIFGQSTGAGTAIAAASSSTGMAISAYGTGSGTLLNAYVAGTGDGLCIGTSGGTKYFNVTSTGLASAKKSIQVSTGSDTSTYATDGAIRGQKSFYISARNNADSANIVLLGITATDDLVLGANTYANGGGAAPTLGTIGGSGPTAAAQNGWVKMYIGGGYAWLPYWR